MISMLLSFLYQIFLMFCSVLFHDNIRDIDCCLVFEAASTVTVPGSESPATIIAKDKITLIKNCFFFPIYSYLHSEIDLRLHPVHFPRQAVATMRSKILVTILIMRLSIPLHLPVPLPHHFWIRKVLR